MKLYVPEIGDQFKLTTDWSFDLYEEHRNSTLWALYDCDKDPAVSAQRQEETRLRDELDKIYSNWRRDFGSPYGSSRDPKEVEEVNLIREKLYSMKMNVVNVTLPAGAVLSVDRIFIRKGMDDWSSLTFFLKEHPTMTFKKKPRFWAKLHDCNRIEFEPHTS